LIIENLGSAKVFNLRLRVGPNAEEVTARAGLTIEAGSVIRLKPSDWSTAASTAPIRMDILDKTWQKVLNSSSV
jgi:hypothetical protein